MNKYIPIHIIPDILYEEDVEIVIEDIVNDKDFQKSDREIETQEPIEELKYLQDYDVGGIIILNDLNEKQRDEPKIQTMFKRGRHKKLSIFIINQEKHELPERTNSASRNYYHSFKSNIYRDV